MQQSEDRTGLELGGIGVSPGVVIGPVFVLADKALQIAERRIEAADVDAEISRFEDALIETRRQIRQIQRDLVHRAGIEDGSFLDAHLMVLDDRSFIEKVVTGIAERMVNVEAVVEQEAEGYAAILASVQDDYLRERVADVRDVARRIVRNLMGHREPTVDDLRQEHIIVAQDLAPSETAAMRKDRVTGIATEHGSPTSHTALMARALEIPAIVGLQGITSKLVTGDQILIDGNKGVLIIEPTQEQLKRYGQLAEARRTIEQELTRLREEPAVTADGKRIVLSANAEGLEEVAAVLNYGAEGVGLFRSEYLFMARDAKIGEDDQVSVYREVAERLAPAPVIIRTLDLGGDKFAVEEQRHIEPNPFLGFRSIRLCLKHPEFFKTQLRAILRAATGGNVKIMYPMISGVGELMQANALLDEAKSELEKEGVPYARKIEVGAMIEIPSAALTADALAPHVNFFSIGTNDLVQYTLAVDRVNERMAYLFEPTHPAVLRLIQQAVEHGHNHGLWVGVCGEMAADPRMTPLLLGLGVDELSVAPAAVPLIKDVLRKVHMDKAADLARTALACRTASDVLGHCRHLTREIAPEIMELM